MDTTKGPTTEEIRAAMVTLREIAIFGQSSGTAERTVRDARNVVAMIRELTEEYADAVHQLGEYTFINHETQVMDRYDAALSGTEETRYEPPQGMPIKVHLRGQWILAEAGRNGIAEIRGGYVDLTGVDWAFLSPPRKWPQWAFAWIVTNNGESHFYSGRVRVGDEIGVHNDGTIAIHVVGREDQLGRTDRVEGNDG